MKLAEKEFRYYWQIIKVPFAILAVWSIAGFLFACYSYSNYKRIFSGMAGFILSIAMFGFIGWVTVKDHKGTIANGAWAGAMTGFIIGVVSSVLSLFMIKIVPAVLEEMVAGAVKQGAPAAIVRDFVMVGMYIGAVLGPFINAAIGAGVSAIGSLTGKKIK